MTVVLIVLILAFMVVTVYSLTAMLVLRRREKERDESYNIAKTVEEMDAALNAALQEINKLGALIQEEIDEKYKTMLFLYNLVDDKHREISETADGEVISEMMERYIEKHSEKLIVEAPKVPEEHKITEEEKVKKPPTFTNPKHKEIWEKREAGQPISDIAKELNMGQGEVKLILDLIDMAD